MRRAAAFPFALPNHPFPFTLPVQSIMDLSELQQTPLFHGLKKELARSIEVSYILQ